MARQPRVEFEGALHHAMSRGNDGIDIYRDDADRERFLALLAEEVARSRWTLHDYCLMSNHYHLVISTPECTLSTGMHRLLGRYVQYFNRRHRRRGHLFQERFKNVLVEEESHGVVLSRYVALNPVKARICAQPEDWRWSSYRARGGFDPIPAWLSVEPLAAQLGANTRTQQSAYREFVLAALGVDDGFAEALLGSLVGTAAWIQRVQTIIDGEERSADHPRATVHPGRPDLDAVIEAVAQTFDTTGDQIAAAHGTIERQFAAFLAFEEGLIPLRRIAGALGLLSAGRVSALVRECRETLVLDPEMRQLAEACRARMRRRPPPFLLAADAGVRFARSYHRRAAPSLR